MDSGKCSRYAAIGQETLLFKKHPAKKKKPQN